MDTGVLFIICCYIIGGLACEVVPSSSNMKHAVI